MREWRGLRTIPCELVSEGSIMVGGETRSKNATTPPRPQTRPEPRVLGQPGEILLHSSPAAATPTATAATAAPAAAVQPRQILCR